MHERENESGQPGMIRQMRQTFGAMHLICAALSAPVAAMSTRPGSIGVKYMGLPMFVGLASMVLVLGLVPPQRDEMVRRGTQAAVLIGFFVLCLVAHRVAAAFGRGGGRQEHSMYTGRPVIPGDEAAVKGVVVPALMLFAGMVVVVPMPGLGTWLLMASAAQAVCTEVEKQGVAAQARAMRDARIEQQAVFDHLRKGEPR